MDFKYLAKIVVGRGRNRKLFPASELFRFIQLEGSPMPMLPIGYWPREEADGESGGETGRPAVVLPERFNFLRQLGPVREIPGISMGRNRSYRAFQVNGFIIVENETYGNAIYVYSAGNSWATDVEKTKWQNLQKIGQSALIGRVNHKGNWQHRLIDLVKGVPKNHLNHKMFEKYMLKRMKFNWNIDS